MDFSEIFLIALALSVDAAVFAFSYGLVLRHSRMKNSVILAIVTGAFQAGMPIIGFFGAGKIRPYVEAWDHWIAFIVFLLLGLSILRNTWLGQGEDEDPSLRDASLSAHSLFIVGLATSIDALAIGACIACMVNPAEGYHYQTILPPAGIIGLTTFFCTVIAFHLSHSVRHLPTKWLETAAGLTLIGLGINTLCQHIG